MISSYCNKDLKSERAFILSIRSLEEVLLAENAAANPFCPLYIHYRYNEVICQFSKVDI